MRVTGTMIAQTALRNINANVERLDKLQNQLTSGKRISRPSDDPSVFTVQVPRIQLAHVPPRVATPEILQTPDRSPMTKTLSDRLWKMDSPYASFSNVCVNTAKSLLSLSVPCI